MITTTERRLDQLWQARCHLAGERKPSLAVKSALALLDKLIEDLEQDEAEEERHANDREPEPPDPEACHRRWVERGCPGEP